MSHPVCGNSTVCYWPSVQMFPLSVVVSPPPRHTEASGSQLVGREQNGHHYKHGFCWREYRWPGGGGGGRKKILPLWTVLSCPAKEVTNLTLAGAFLRFQGHFYSFILEDIVFEKNINNEEIRWACCWQQRQEASALFWPALEGRGYSFKIIRRPSFPFFLSGNI